MSLLPAFETPILPKSGIGPNHEVCIQPLDTRFIPIAYTLTDIESTFVANMKTPGMELITVAHMQ